MRHRCSLARVESISKLTRVSGGHGRPALAGPHAFHGRGRHTTRVAGCRALIDDLDAPAASDDRGYPTSSIVTDETRVAADTWERNVSVRRAPPGPRHPEGVSSRVTYRVRHPRGRPDARRNAPPGTRRHDPCVPSRSPIRIKRPGSAPPPAQRLRRWPTRR